LLETPVRDSIRLKSAAKRVIENIQNISDDSGVKQRLMADAYLRLHDVEKQGGDIKQINI
jgi:hypothetical protein